MKKEMLENHKKVDTENFGTLIIFRLSFFVVVKFVYFSMCKPTVGASELKIRMDEQKMWSIICVHAYFTATTTGHTMIFIQNE